MHVQIPVFPDFDHRFICKVALGIGTVLFNEHYLRSPLAEETRRGMWRRPDDPVRRVRGSSTFNANHDVLGQWIGFPGALSVQVMRAGRDWVLRLAFEEGQPFTVELGSTDMTSTWLNAEEGYSLLLFPYLGQAIELTTAELLMHHSKVQRNPALVAIEDRLDKAIQFRQAFVGGTRVGES